MNSALPLRTIRLAALLALGLVAGAACARPRVGLVLGGGGARGAAHIGVLEVLEKLRVPVDCVAGTSMGALVAGAYAAGLSPAEMRAELAKANWHDMFLDNPEYSELNYRNKELSRRFLPATETGVGANGAQYQAGMVSGQKIKLFFNRLVRADRGEPDIQTLPLPLSIIATDIGSGERVVFRDGSLTQAMRASMSVPGLMAPVDHQGRKLVDGGLVDNVPVREARERCRADVTIAVNVGSPLLKPEEVGSLLTVSAQMVNILTEQNVSQSLASLTSADIYIKPDLDGIGAGDFRRTAETADRGRQAAEKVADRLGGLAVDAESYSAWRRGIAPAARAAPRVDEIQIAGLHHVNPAVVERHIRLGEDRAIDTDELDRGLLRVYGDGDYENVDYSLLAQRDRNILRIAPVEKRWGPDYLRFGINLESSLKQDSSYSLRVGYHKTWLNSLGGQMLGIAEIGRRSAVGVEYYQPVEERQRFFVEAALGHTNELKSLYQNGQRRADFKDSKTTATLGGGTNVGLLGQIRAGWRAVRVETTLDTGLPLFPITGEKRYGGGYASIDFDQRDRLYSATKGWASRVSYFASPAEGYSKLNADLRGAHSLGSVVVAGRMSYQGSPRGRLPIYDAAALGGFLNLSGFAQGQLLGDDMRYAQVRAEKIIGKLPVGLRGDMRVGLALEAAKVGLPYSETGRAGRLNSTTLFLGGETPFGQVYLGYGYSTSGSSNIYLFLGTP
ncbi:MAG: patatin-like phospholipase family protein [Betaproteobacteria bacterium]|nr:patatin-like phospholipase family protein [Betaproteobacteria bacterium]